MKLTPRDVLFAVWIGVCAGLLYWPTLRFGFTGLDDHSLILQRVGELASPTALVSAFTRAYDSAPHCLYYRPLVTVTFALNAMVSGGSPMGYHATNVGLHVLASMLVYALCRKTIGNVTPALLGALLFALSPTNTEAVAWIPGRCDLWLGCFTLGALLSLQAGERELSRLRFVVHVSCFMGALFTKETAVCLPLVFFFAVRAMRHPLSPRTQAELWAAWALSVGAYVFARVRVLSPNDGYLEALFTVAIHRGAVLLAELGKLVFPVRQEVLMAPDSLRVGPGIAIGLGLASLIALTPRLRTRRLLFAGVLTVCPLVMNLLASQTIVLECRLYVPMAGIALLIAELLQTLGERAPLRANLVTALVGVHCLVLGHKSYRYSRDFENPRRFARAALAAAPSSAVARSLMFRAAHPEALAPAPPWGGRKGDFAK